MMLANWCFRFVNLYMRTTFSIRILVLEILIFVFPSLAYTALVVNFVVHKIMILHVLCKTMAEGKLVISFHSVI